VIAESMRRRDIGLEVSSGSDPIHIPLWVPRAQVRHKTRFTCRWDGPGPLARFRTAERLDNVVRGSGSDEARARKLLHWTRAQFEPGRPDPYPPPDATTTLREIRSKHTGGFCAQYAFVLVQALQSFGQPARVVTRLTGGATPIKLDSAVANGQVNLRWPARLASGDPVPAGDYNIIVEATVGQNNFSTSQPIRVTHGAVDTLPHLTSLPGYTYLPETEVPPKSWKPMGLALVYTGIALAGTSALSTGDLGKASLREGGMIGGGIVLAGFVMTLKKPAPQPARGNILYNQLLREQISRRNTEIAQENTRRRQQVALSVVPVARGGGR